MRNLKKILMAALTAGMVFCLTAGSALASEASYSHKLTLYAGNQGTIAKNGEAVYQVPEDEVESVLSSLTSSDLVNVPDDSKYYFRGFHLAGQDELVTSVQFDEDVDLVASYGIRGELVQYRINYVSEDGAELYASDTMYGNVGEQPVIAYRYIEGYQPQAYNLTKTLSGNAADNDITFVYRSTAPEVIVVETPAQPAENAAAPAETPAENAAAPAETPAENAATAPAETPAAAAPDATADDVVAAADEEVPLAGGEPEDLVNLDDEEVPLADLAPENSGVNAQQNAASGLSAGMIAGIIVAIAAVVIALLAVVKKKKAEASK